MTSVKVQTNRDLMYVLAGNFLPNMHHLFPFVDNVEGHIGHKYEIIRVGIYSALHPRRLENRIRKPITNSPKMV